MGRSAWQLVIIVVMIIIIGLSNIPHLTFFNETTLPASWAQFIANHTYRIGESGFFSYNITPHPDYIIHKLGHIVLFGLLGVSAFFATGRSVWLAILIVGSFACLDELHQYFVPGRSSRLGDIILDSMAALVFISLAKLLYPQRRSRSRRRFGGKGSTTRKPGDVS